MLLRIVLILVLLLVGGCSVEPITRDLTQKQASQIVAVLNFYGISSHATPDSDHRGKYVVSVDPDHYTEAMAVLNDHDLPRDDKFSAAIEPRGLLPNSREMEKLRVENARALEIEELIESHPAVSSAKVVISHDTTTDNLQPAVSIVAQLRSGRTIPETEIKDLVKGLLPGTQPDNIHVSLAQSDTPGNVVHLEGANNQKGVVIRVPLTGFLFDWQVASDDYDSLALAVGGLVLIAAILGVLIGYFYGSFRRVEQDLGLSLPEPAVRSGKFERGFKQLPEE